MESLIKTGPKSLKTFQLLVTCQNVCYLLQMRVSHISPKIRESDLNPEKNLGCPSSLGIPPSHTVQLALAWSIHFLGCCSKLPLILWAQTAEMYFLPFLEMRSPKSKCMHIHASSWGPRESIPCLFQLLAAPGVCWHSLISTPMFMWFPPLPYQSFLCLSYQDTYECIQDSLNNLE